MKKDECISKFVASLIIAFPFMAMLAFLVELFTIEIFIEISKNHGSLIAGVLGVLGVIFLVINQNNTTKELIKNSEFLIEKERFYIDKSRVEQELLFIRNNLERVLNSIAGFSILSEADFKGLFEGVEPRLVHVKLFLQRHGRRFERTYLLDLIKNFSAYHLLLIDDSESKAGDVLQYKITSSILLDLLNEQLEENGGKIPIQNTGNKQGILNRRAKVSRYLDSEYTPDVDLIFEVWRLILEDYLRVLEDDIYLMNK